MTLILWSSIRIKYKASFKVVFLWSFGPGLTWDLLGPADHEHQLLVCQVGEGHHHAGLGEGLLQVLHQVDLRRLRLHDAGDELLGAHGRVVGEAVLGQGGEGGLQVEAPLGPGAQPHPDQIPSRRVPGPQSSTAVPRSSVAAALTPHTCRAQTDSQRGRSFFFFQLYTLV